MKLKKTKVALGVASALIAISGTLVAPQAVAHSKAEKVAVATDKKVQALENQVNQMADMMRAMSAELSRVKAQTANMSGGDDNRVTELETWMASVKNAPVIPETKDNMVFFRGGWAHNNSERGGVSINSSTNVNTLLGVLTGQNNGGRGDNNGWYVGAGFDFSVNDNLFGLMDNTEFLAELGVNYKDYGSTSSNLLASHIGNGGLIARSVQVSSLQVTASPKIKFMKGSKFRPWIIPAGLSLNVISPPSESITVAAPGIMFGGGADYNVWEDLYLGIDARYHIIGDQDGVDQDGFEVGGYLGFGF